MSLLLTLEQGPRAQAVRQTRLDKGELVIGRSPDADWQIEDPDMFVSRAHCKITADRDGYLVTDTSSSGLFVDNAGSPLGAGNSMRLKNGMRLRLGDYVLWVEMQVGEAAGQPAPARAAPPAPTPSRAPVGIGSDDFFAATTEEAPPTPRPADLPNPFEQPEAGAFRAYERSDAAERTPPAFDDPFSLDPVPTPASTKGVDERSATSTFSDPFAPDTGMAAAPSRPAPSPAEFDDGFAMEPATPAARPEERRAPAARSPSPAPWDLPVQPAAPSPPARAPQPKPGRPQAHAAPSDLELRAAFMRGMGLDDAEASDRDPVAEMERLGRQYRMMMEGLMQLLRKRAEEKGNARLEQTVVGASEVNPLKFLPTVDDALATILAERSAGFLNGDAAIQDAVRDLAHHHVRAWRGLQGALRRMIDRFDPAALEEELKSSSSLETLLAGGRGAKLWELYKKRHREIAVSAETRFMGEIGADFRNAYEEE
ncbi:type VI secretion system-associated FHA domain protein TagH [Aminobacter sp. Piv2-1]|uniref:type VI secretion system-associated FHA domain protein TagH n=1 Tax=Aminobacter sp. Piv2-1 TaxID=3031122 RepID=UPI0030A4A08C